jgi:lipopolysaccharide transport system ATP-binding protein
MAEIQFKEVSIAFPIFNAESRSLKNKVLSLSTGGQLGLNAKGVAEIQALDHINFNFKNGERIGLIGHNGSGKSTLLRALSGVYAPQHGSIKIQGETTSLIDISLGINAEFTGRENILIRGSLLGLTRKQIEERTDEIIAFTELGEFIDMPLRTYSSGMQLRLAFAISTTITPEILLMDEWLAVGDENFKHKAEERMQKLADKSSILVIASHSKEQILKVCNRVLWLEHGNIKMDGDPATVCSSYFS